MEKILYTEKLCPKCWLAKCAKPKNFEIIGKLIDDCCDMCYEMNAKIFLAANYKEEI